MVNEEILKPELKLLKKDEYYLFYEMLMQSLKMDDVKLGIHNSLSLLRYHLKSGNVSLYRKEEDGTYSNKINDSNLQDLKKTINCIVDKTSTLVEGKGMLHLNLEFSERINNLIMIHIKLEESDWILSINKMDEAKNLEQNFWEQVKETMKIILKRAASYERNITAINTDLLTGVDNRNSYETRIQKLNESEQNLVFGIFDIFRLKYINDNHSHPVGDLYIKKTAEILKKYWPKYEKKNHDEEVEKKETGHCIYRIGGDEFALLTTVENIKLTKVKAKLACEEASLMDLGLGKDIPLGLNRGIVLHQPNDFIKNTTMRADEIMSKDKALMYSKYNLERRR